MSLAFDKTRIFSRDWWLAFLHDTDKPARDPVAGWVTLLTGVVVSFFLYWRNHTSSLPDMSFDEYNLLNTACILGIPLFVLLVFLRREPTEFGMTIGDSKAGNKFAVLAALIFTPIILIAAMGQGAQSYYLGWMSDREGGSRAFTGYLKRFIFDHNLYYARFFGGHINWSQLAYHQLAMGFYMFGWEFFFRGFLLSGSRKLLPFWWAILVQTAFFCALHVGKPLPELLSSFPGGILMALVAIRYRSFLPCFLLHVLISAGNDFAVLYFHFHPVVLPLPAWLLRLG